VPESTSGEHTKPNEGNSLPNIAGKSILQASCPVWQSRLTKTSRIPATYNRLPSQKGVDRIQSPFDFAKNGTDKAPDHRFCHWT
jgi:hypothetical protein